MRHWLKEFIYRVDISGWLFVMAGTGATLIVLLTGSFSEHPCCKDKSRKCIAECLIEQ